VVKKKRKLIFNDNIILWVVELHWTAGTVLHACLLYID
jgi:hypothetical protein